MSPYDPPSRYGFPPLPDKPVVLPEEVPWDTPISDLCGFWIDTHCTCGHGQKPLRLLAATIGWTVTLREVVPRLVCPKCREPYSDMFLIADASYQGKRHGGREQRRLDLLAT